jgi:4-diphosphocytidyl-2-C-methyl-D-erythritol kinase
MQSRSPARLLIRAYAKVNLGLEILARRPDGFHEIRTVLQTIDLADDISIWPRARGIRLECVPPTVPADQSNLILRAASLLQRRFPGAGGARVLLTKRIPVGAGLGGGSSDAAAALVGLRRLWRLPVRFDELHSLAAELGSDVPFFLRGGTALATGRGEILQRQPGLGSVYFVLAVPGIPVSTAWAYCAVRIELTAQSNCITMLLSALPPRNIGKIARSLSNDLEKAVFPAHSLLPNIKRLLVAEGSIGALMSGSGSSVFGIATDRAQALRIAASIPLRQLLHEAHGSLTIVRACARGWEFLPS